MLFYWTKDVEYVDNVIEKEKNRMLKLMFISVMSFIHDIRVQPNAFKTFCYFVFIRHFIGHQHEDMTVAVIEQNLYCKNGERKRINMYLKTKQNRQLYVRLNIKIVILGRTRYPP